MAWPKLQKWVKGQVNTWKWKSLCSFLRSFCHNQPVCVLDWFCSAFLTPQIHRCCSSNCLEVPAGSALNIQWSYAIRSVDEGETPGTDITGPCDHTQPSWLKCQWQQQACALVHPPWMSGDRRYGNSWIKKTLSYRESIIAWKSCQWASLAVFADP